MRSTSEQFIAQLRMLDPDSLAGRLTTALLQSKMSFTLAAKLLGCSRSTFYAWCQGDRRLTPKYASNVRLLTLALIYANDHRWTPCTTDAEYVQVLLNARTALQNND